MKKCTRCGESKKQAEFQIRKASNDGFTAACKACLKVYDKSRANLPHRVALRNEYQKTRRGIKTGNAAKARWNARNRDKRAAQILLCNAVKYGKIKRGHCEVCGATKRIHGHHDDYTKPLEVRWLCAAHHSAFHAKP